MSIYNGPKISTIVSAADGDAYGPQMRQLFRMLQVLVQPNIISLITSTPPTSPNNGDTYIVAAPGTGAWSGQDNNIAYWTTDDLDNFDVGKWEFWAPLPGWMVVNRADGFIYTFNGTAWVEATAGGGGGGGSPTGSGAYGELYGANGSVAVPTANVWYELNSPGMWSIGGQ